MALGYLVKRAANGVVVIQEKIVPIPQGFQSNFLVDNDCAWIFQSWDQAAAWLGMKIAAEGQSAQVVQINPPTPLA